MNSFTRNDRRMGKPSRFMFENEFETGSAADGAEASKWYTGKEIAALRDETFRAGVEDGANRERASTGRRQAEALDAIQDRMAGIADAQGVAIERVADQAAGLALAIARKVAPALMRRQPLAELEAMIRDFLQQLIDEPRVVVRVPDALLDGLKERIDGLATACGFSGRVILLPDAGLARGDCRLEWADGGAERDTGATWRAIEATIDRLLQSPNDPDERPHGDARAPVAAQAAPATPTQEPAVPAAP